MAQYLLKRGPAVLAEAAGPFVYDAAQGRWDGPDISYPDPERALRLFRTGHVMSPIRFKAQFTLREQISISFARGYAPANPNDPLDERLQLKLGLDLLFSTLADLVAMGKDIDVSDPAVIAGIQFCATAGILTPERADEILAGAEIEI